MKKPVKKYKSSTGGSFMVDREIRGVGRIHRASGLTDERQFALLNNAIPDLATSKKGRAALLAFKDGQIDGRQLFVAIKSDDMDSLIVGDAARTLIAALEQWHMATESRVATATHRVP